MTTRMLCIPVKRLLEIRDIGRNKLAGLEFFVPNHDKADVENKLQFIELLLELETVEVEVVEEPGVEAYKLIKPLEG